MSTSEFLTFSFINMLTEFAWAQIWRSLNWSNLAETFITSYYSLLVTSDKKMDCRTLQDITIQNFIYFYQSHQAQQHFLPSYQNAIVGKVGVHLKYKTKTIGNFYLFNSGLYELCCFTSTALQIYNVMSSQSVTLLSSNLIILQKFWYYFWGVKGEDLCAMCLIVRSIMQVLYWAES